MDLSDTESLEAEPTATPLPAQSASSFAAARSAMAQSAAAAAQDAPSEEEEETPTPAPPVKRGRPKGSKDNQPRTRTKPVHTPSKQYVDAHDTVHQNSPNSAAAPLQYFEEAMEHARQQEMTRRQTLYTSWLPY